MRRNNWNNRGHDNKSQVCGSHDTMIRHGVASLARDDYKDTRAVTMTSTRDGFNYILALLTSFEEVVKTGCTSLNLRLMVTKFSRKPD